MKQTFYFNTGVKPYSLGSPKYHIEKGNVIDANGVMLIPFVCEDVPEGAQFAFACDNPNLPDYSGSHIVRPILEGGLLSKFAYFKKAK